MYWILHTHLLYRTRRRVLSSSPNEIERELPWQWNEIKSANCQHRRVTIVMVRGDDSDTVHSIPKREINPGAFPPGTRTVSLSSARHAIPFLRASVRSELHRVHVSASCKILTPPLCVCKTCGYTNTFKHLFLFGYPEHRNAPNRINKTSNRNREVHCEFINRYSNAQQPLYSLEIIFFVEYYVCCFIIILIFTMRRAKVSYFRIYCTSLVEGYHILLWSRL